MIHPLKVRVGATKKIGLCSTIENSPLLIALRRLSVSPILLDTAELRDEDLSSFSY